VSCCWAEAAKDNGNAGVKNGDLLGHVAEEFLTTDGHRFTQILRTEMKTMGIKS
jgi:hypothetical protein